MTLVALIRDAAVVARILRRLRLPDEVPVPRVAGLPAGFAPTLHAPAAHPLAAREAIAPGKK